MIGRLLEMLADSPRETEEDHQQRIAIATCALMLELAYADGEFDEQEENFIYTLIDERFELSAEAREELLELADQKRHASVDLYTFTSSINDHFSPEEKLQLVHELWRLIFSDGSMHHHEEYLIRRISDLLRIPHRKMIQAKLDVKQQLSG